MADFIVDDGNVDSDLLYPQDFGRGLVERDFGVQAMRAVQMPLIPRSEWSDRIKEMEAEKSRLSDVRGGIPSLDQGRWGYCWAHSTTHAVTLLRAAMNQPYVPLSAFAVAATIKRGRDEGGWGAQSLEFISQRGVPAQSFWPQQDARLSNGTAACWENAALHKVSESWVDVAAPVYDRELSFDQVATCLLSGTPVIGDFNWWGHSVCLMDLVEVEKGSFGVRIWNSWSDSWGDRGTAVLRGGKAVPDNATAPRVTRPSQA